MSRRVAPRREVKAVWGRSRSESESEQGVWGGAEQTRNQVSYPWPGCRPGNAGWRAEPIDGSKSRDELWVEVKCQTNLEIAGSPRNAFRFSLGADRRGGRALAGRAGESLATPTKPRMPRRCCPRVRRWGLSSI